MTTKIEKTKVGAKYYTEIIVEDDGFVVTLCDLGASIRDIMFKGKHMIVSPKSFEEFVTNGSYYGRTIGRTAGRIGGGSFTIDKKQYQLKLNADNLHSMHGGLDGLAFKIWDYNVDEEADRVMVRFTYFMPHMDDGFPGNLSTKVTYTIANNKVRIDYEATTSEDTLVNLANHTYFNIAGDVCHNVRNQKLYINALKYGRPDFTKLIDSIIPITFNNPFDFSRPRLIGEKIDDPKVVQITNGYDHCYILEKNGLKDPAAILVDEEANTKLSVYTTYPCVVIYTCNYTDDLVVLGKDAPVERNDAICFECQFVPNGINMKDIKKNENGLLKKKDKYNQTTIYQFEQYQD